MIKKLLSLLALATLGFSGEARAQLGPSTNGPMYNPNWYTGYVPTALQWGLLWSNKMDYFAGGVPIVYGGTGATNASQALRNLGAASSSLASGQIFVGNSVNQTTPAAPSGDLSMSNIGVFTVTKTNGVSFTYFATGTDASHLTGSITPSVVPLFTQTVRGAVPPPNDGGTSLFLREDGTWHAPPGFGTVTSVGLSTPGIFTPTGTPVTGAGTLGFTLNSQSPNLVWAGPTSGGAAAPTFRALVAADIPSGLGYVTSVGLTLPSSVLTVAGSPVTGAGTLSATFANQSANTFFSGPSSGGATTPTFRGIIAADLPFAQTGSGAVSQNMTLALQRVAFKPQDYGTIGGSDDGIAINACLSAAATVGGICLVPHPPSAYQYTAKTTINVVQGTSLVCENSNVVIDSGQNGMTDLIKVTSTINGSVENCVLNNSYDTVNGINFAPTVFGNNLLFAIRTFVVGFVNNYYNSNADDFVIQNAWSQNATGYDMRSIYSGTASRIDGFQTLGSANGLYYSPTWTASSSTSNTIGTGSKTFTVSAGLTALPSQIVRITNDVSHSMVGTVTSYSGTTMVINVVSTVGTGTFSSWTFGGQTTEGPIISNSNILVTSAAGVAIKFDQGLFIQISNTDYTGPMFMNGTINPIAVIHLTNVWGGPSGSNTATIGADFAGNIADINISGFNSAGWPGCGLNFRSTSTLAIQRGSIRAYRGLVNGTDLCIDTSLNGVTGLVFDSNWLESSASISEGSNDVGTFTNNFFFGTLSKSAKSFYWNNFGDDRNPTTGGWDHFYLYTTVNGTQCAIFTICTITAAATQIAPGTTTVSPNTNSKGLFYNNAGTVGVLASGNSGVWLTDGSGNTSNSTTLPSGLAMQTPASINLTNASALPASALPAFTGDITTSAGSSSTTLATVAAAGTVGSSTAIPVVTIDIKGRTTTLSSAAVIAPAGTLSGATLNSGVTASSLTSLGTLTSMTSSGTILSTKTAGGSIFQNSSMGINAGYVNFQSSGNNITYASECSTGGCIYTGTTAYAAVLGESNGIGVQIAVGNNVRATFSNTGLTETGFVSAAAASGFQLGGTQAFYQNGNYTTTLTSNAVAALAMGNASDPTNFYTNTTHNLRGLGGTSMLLLTATAGTFNMPVLTKGYTVSTLPASPGAGARAHVTDQLTTCAAIGAALVGGGAVTCPAFYNGTAWVSG